MNALESRHHRLNPSLFPLADMVAESIGFLREHEPPEGYFVGFSGGKDSIVVLELCRLAGVKHQAFYSATGIDPPEVVKFIRREYPEVTLLRPAMTFWEGIRRKSPPLSMQRWCCDVLKKHPSKHIPLKFRIMGIRAEESVRRAARPRIEAYNKGPQVIYKPIFDWAEWHIWDFIDINRLPYPSLYDDGWGRIGCMFCPFIVGPGPAAQKRLQKAKERWPGFYRVFEKVVSEWFVNRLETSDRQQIQKTPAEYLAAYYRGFE